MSEAVEEYLDKIVKAAKPKLRRLFNEKSNAENIRKYDWCGKLTYEFKHNDKKHDTETTDNPATFTFTAKKLEQPTELTQNLTREEVADRANKVADALDKALKEETEKLKKLQEKGFLFCHEKLDVGEARWRGGSPQYGEISINFFTYDK